LEKLGLFLWRSTPGEKKMIVKGVRGGQLRILTNEQIHQIHLATLRILDEVGIKIQSRQALELMADNGCKVNFNKEIVKIPEYILKEWLQSAPSTITLYGKTSSFNVVLNDMNTVYTLGGAGAIFVLDLKDHRRRATLEDLINFTTIQDALENPNIAHLHVLPQDIPSRGSDRIVFATMLKYTRKPQHAPSGGAQGVRDHIRMAAVILGGTKKVSAKPCFVENICPQSPLFLPKETAEELMETARNHIPLIIEVDAQAGGTAPFTIAGTLVEQNANILAAIVLAQMVSLGAPCIYGTASGIMDMQTANYSGTAPESTLLHLASAQLAHFYHLPFQGGNPPDSKLPDTQMGYERASHFLALALGGCNIIHTATGNLEQSRLSNYEQCIIDDEILKAIFRIVEGLEVNEDTLAVEVLREIGPGGNFLTHPHTLQYLHKNRWMPKITNRESWETWEKTGRKNMRARAKEEVKKILQTCSSRYLSEDKEKEIDRIAKELQRKVLEEKDI
jgi:trimethylamine--corrinoid protein Co-methyltransferase